LRHIKESGAAMRKKEPSQPGIALRRDDERSSQMAYVTLDLDASRRRMLQSAAGLALGTLVLGAFGAAPPALAAAAKMPQKAVDYQDHAKAGHSCNSCKDFKPPQSCKTVEGPVQASGWCNKYVHS
jgi:hypothetical protein